MKYYEKILNKLITRKIKELDDTHFSQRDYWPLDYSYIRDDVISDFLRYLDTDPSFVTLKLWEHYKVVFSSTKSLIVPKNISTKKYQKLRVDFEKKANERLVAQVVGLYLGDKKLKNPKFVKKVLSDLDKLAKKYK